jgi:glycosyltransferase involved in cell wall biosynthesis
MTGWSCSTWAAKESPMGNLLASVIIDNYNYARFLAEAIDSALAQTYPDVEVIVVDDGSTDGSREVIASYAGRVAAVLKPNGGMASAYNAGFAASRGQVVFFLDSDDLFLPGAVAAAMPFFSDPSVAKVHWPLWEVDERGARKGRVIPAQGLAAGDFRDATLRLGPDAYLSPPTSGNAWSRRLLEQILPAPEPEYRQHADTYLATLAPLFGTVEVIAEPQALYRIHGSNDYASRSAAEKNRRNLQIYDRRCDTLSACLARRGDHVAPQVWKLSNPYYSWMSRLRAATEELSSVVPAGETFIFVDQDQCGDRWGGSELIDGRRALPFLERDGQYWGPPPDDETAIREMDRLRRAGAGFVAFAWPAFWWLDHYAAFHRHLRESFLCLLRNDRLVVFDLHSPGGASPAT